MSRPATLGQLRETGWQSVPVKEEVRRNVAARIAAGKPAVTGVVGYEDTVLPQLENALLAGHDTIFLGERGQAKTRIIRSLTELLDEWMPVVAGSEINDDPYNPVSRHARDLVRDHGEDTPIEWVHRSTRFGEKLATPDTSIADLIGEVDPIKVAEGRYLSDELTLHYGLVPRTNRGIFAINELPDLAERIQVGLLNVLEERDVQIRGYKVRLPLDVMLVASANPEDYTNRGRIITPLKDRFGAEVRTHYPLDVDAEVDVVRQEAHLTAEVGEPLLEVLARFVRHLRESTAIDQRSGVSARFAVAAAETVAAAALRRSAVTGEEPAVARPVDLEAVPAVLRGKLEFEPGEEGRENELLEYLLRRSVADTARERFAGLDLTPLAIAVAEGHLVTTGERVPAKDVLAALPELPILYDVAARAGVDPGDSPGRIAAAVELALEALYLSKRLAKDADNDTTIYGA
ncbi:MAG: magnesium chelatase subunit [Kribbellaceae bacterium]|nr:magnesium chelatase subunit [Kribbellaceae bacterium]